MWIIDEDLSAIEALVSEHGKDMLKRNSRNVSAEFLADLNAFGFEQTISQPGLRIYVHAQKELVLKVSYICSDDHCKIPKLAVPSLVLASGGYEGRFAVILQPLVDCSPEVQSEIYWKADRLPYKEVCELFGSDFAPRNLGRWKTQDVAIDW